MYVLSNHSDAKTCVGTSHEFDGNPSFKEYANIISMSSEIFKCGANQVVILYKAAIIIIPQELLREVYCIHTCHKHICS